MPCGKRRKPALTINATGGPPVRAHLGDEVKLGMHRVLPREQEKATNGDGVAPGVDSETNGAEGKE